MKLPAFQFYPGDWRKDPGLQSLEYHERGIWMELLCLMHESEERGVLVINGLPASDAQIGRLLGLDKQTTTNALSSLLTAGVAKRRECDGAIYSKRMVGDQKLRTIRAECGKKGGNPRLLNQNPTTGDKQPDNQMPTPSSSSSSSDEDLSAAALDLQNQENPDKDQKYEISCLPRLKNGARLSDSELEIYREAQCEADLLSPSTLPTTKSESKLPTTKKIPGYREGAICGGEFGRVWLKPKELEKLTTHHDRDLVRAKIAYLDSAIQDGIKKYVEFKDHYATIRRWLLPDRVVKHEHIHKQESKTAAQKREFNEQAKMVETQITQREREEYLRAMEAEQ